MAVAMLPPPMKVMSIREGWGRGGRRLWRIGRPHGSTGAVRYRRSTAARPPSRAPEDRGADAHHRRALGDRGLEVVGHAHGERVERRARRARARLQVAAQDCERAARASARRRWRLAMPMRPRSRRPGSVATARASASASPGWTPPLVASPLTLTCDARRCSGARPAGRCAREDARRASTRSTPCTQSKCSATSRVLLLWSGADEMPDEAGRSASAADLGQRFLHVVLAEIALPGGEGGAHHLGADASWRPPPA